MSNQGDDCYFYYYSTCVKGDSCSFRHCEAAMGSEVVCTLWQESRCFRKICKFRHTEIEKKRSEIPCYWENQSAGCQKANCAFHHDKPRVIDGIFLPPSKGPVLRKEEAGEEASGAAVPPTPAPSALPNPANPQLRGVIKADNSENVPSPTHPPVVINPADDEDEDDEDQISEEGEELKAGSDSSKLTSPRKLVSSKDDSLNFGIKTLEEIRLRKALKANLKKAGFTSESLPQSATVLSQTAQQKNGNGLEKENVRTVLRLFPSTEEGVPVKGDVPVKRNIAERLGKRKAALMGDVTVLVNKELAVVSDLPLKRSLADRLGRKVNCTDDSADIVPPKVPKPVRERLGLPVEHASSEMDCGGQGMSTGEIRIKTLEEIRQEKAAKAQMGGEKTQPEQAPAKVSIPNKKTIKAPANAYIKTFSEILHAKNQKQTEEQSKAVKDNSSDPLSTPMEKEAAPEVQAPGKGAPAQGEVRVKTLEEIRREKAARMQSKLENAGNQEKSVTTSKDGAPEPTRRRILRINKSAGAACKEEKKTAELTEKNKNPPVQTGMTNGKGDQPVEKVKVKSFEEIMREKRLRRQQVESAACPPQPMEASPSSVKPEEALQAQAPQTERSPISVRQRASKACAPQHVPTSVQQKTSPPGPSKPRITLRKKETVPVPKKEQGPVAVEKKDSHSPEDSATTSKQTPISPVMDGQGGSSAAQVPEAGTLSSAESPGISSPLTPNPEPQAEKSEEAAAKRSTTHPPQPKVRPKLNVKPSVVKPATPVRLGQKRKVPESHRSAVAAVKPLNSAPAASEEQEQDLLCRWPETPALTDTEADMTSSLQSPQIAEPAKKARTPVPESPRQDPSTIPQEEPDKLSVTQSPATPQAEPQRPPAPECELPVPKPSAIPARDTLSVPQSSAAVTSPPVRATPLAKTRRLSSASSRVPGTEVDDFEELIKEFDDGLDNEIELDPAKDDEDLLLELSEMIGS
uniref:Zinc finger CCCH-type containing 11A n=1 Tax=Lepisosteus oculatus TaxID=7918 RepID=W5N215_LEPOC|nr:PREDICTED: zinc finger CCCH domain-containing protein 11A [Lepisosteus oculatus]XP_015198231.1 PREDICTED: zinc finger CCCH domain-containing protein 11A [Lepisosteus oculatus]XP_015198233.1 PREDICTED: zinc finger CCCH domain-containing protein 11A [Lepisosteus oculatus]